MSRNVTNYCYFLKWSNTAYSPHLLVYDLTAVDIGTRPYGSATNDVNQWALDYTKWPTVWTMWACVLLWKYGQYFYFSRSKTKNICTCWVVQIWDLHPHQSMAIPIFWFIHPNSRGYCVLLWHHLLFMTVIMGTMIEIWQLSSPTQCPSNTIITELCFKKIIEADNYANVTFTKS